MSRMIGDMTGNIFEEEDSTYGPTSQPNGFQSFKRTRLPLEAQPRADSGFVGLQNQGMTCYLNSLLQTMFLTPELRAGLYQVPVEDLGMNTEEMRPEASPETMSASAAETSGAIAGQQVELPPGQVGKEDVAVDLLTGMGFPEADAKYALKKFNNDTERAVDWLIGRASSGDRLEMSEDDAETYRDLPALESPDEDSGLDLNAMVEHEVSRIAAAAVTPHFDNGNEGGPSSMELDAYPIGGQNSQVLQDDNVVQDLNVKDEVPTECTGFPRGTIGGSVEPPRLAQDGSWSETAKESSSKSGTAVELKLNDNNVDAHVIAAPSKPKRRRRGLIIELQKAFAWLQAVDQKAISTEDLTKAFGWEGSEARVQHDVHELNRILFDGIEFYLKGTKQESLVKNLYHGMLVNQVECLQCGSVSERQEEFSDIPVVVKGFSSLEESLAAAAKAEMLDGDNQYFCERCQTKVDARRSQRFRSLPPLLTLPLCRFEYDWDRDERRKITTPFSFPLTLNLAPYMAPPAPGDQPGLPANGRTAPPEGPSEPQLFDLLSVVIHSGSAHSGHYHAYIRDMLKEGKGHLEAEPARLTWGLEESGGAEGQVHGGSLLEGAGFNEGLEHAGSAMDALAEAAVQESGRATGGESRGGEGMEAASGRAQHEPANGVDDDEPDYGHWYDFNDSNVSVVHWSAITRQFGGGNECAYMLTYRARLPKNQLLAPPVLEALKEGHHDVMDEGGGVANGVARPSVVDGATLPLGDGLPTGEGSSDVGAQQALAVPAHLAPLVKRKNEQLQEARRRAEETAAREAAEQAAARADSQVRFSVHLPSDGYVRAGHLYSRYEDPSDAGGRLLVLERSATVGQLAILVQTMHKVPKERMALYIVSPKIDTQEMEEPADEEEQNRAPLEFAGLAAWGNEVIGREPDAVTEEIVLDEEGGGVDKQSNGDGALDLDVGMAEAVSMVEKLSNELDAGPSASEDDGALKPKLEGAETVGPRPQRRLDDVLEGVAQSGEEREPFKDRLYGRVGLDQGGRVGTSSSGSSADSRSRGVKRAAEGGELQSRGKYQPEIIRGPQLLEFRDPTEPQTSSESEKRSAGVGEGVGGTEGSGLSISGSAGGGLGEGLSAVNLNRPGEGEAGRVQEMSYASALQPKMKKVRRTIYAIMGRLNLHDVRGRLDKQIQNGGGVLAWSTLDSPPSGVDYPDWEATNHVAQVDGPRDEAGTAWPSPVNNGWEVPPTGWGSRPVFSVFITDRLQEQQLSPLSEPFPVEPNTSVWMLKSEALKRHRRHSPELVGEDDVVLHPLLDGRPGPPLDDNTLAAAAGLADGQELWLQWRGPPGASSDLRLCVSVYGREGLAAAQLPLVVPRSALLVEMVAQASELGAAALRTAQQAAGEGEGEEAALVVSQDLLFGKKAALNMEDDALRTLEELGFKDGDQLLVEDQNARSPETVSVRVHQYVLPHERTADAARAKFLASSMATASTLQGPEAQPSSGTSAHDSQVIAAQADSLAAALSAALAAQKREHAPQRHAGTHKRMGRGLGRGLGAGLGRSRARLKELAPGVMSAAPPGAGNSSRTTAGGLPADPEPWDSPVPREQEEADGGPGQSPYSLIASRLPKRLQRSGSSSRQREQDPGNPSTPAQKAAVPARPGSAAASSLRFQEPGVPPWCFSDAGEVLVAKSATLLQLKQKILALPAFENARGGGDGAVAWLRLREFRESQQGPGLGKEYRDLSKEVAQLGLDTAKQVAVRVLPPEDRPVAAALAPSSDCDSLPELVDYVDCSAEGSGASADAGAGLTSQEKQDDATPAGNQEDLPMEDAAAGEMQGGVDVAMGEASADLDMGEAAVDFGLAGRRVELPTSSGSGTSEGGGRLGGLRGQPGSTSMEVAVGDEPGDEADSTPGLPHPGDPAEPLSGPDGGDDDTAAPFRPFRRRPGPTRHALVLTVQRRVPLPFQEIPQVPQNLAKRAVQALVGGSNQGEPLSEAPPNTQPPPPLVGRFSPTVPPPASSEHGGPAALQGEAASSVALPSPVPQTIPLPEYLEKGGGGQGGPGLPLSDASLGFMPITKKSPAATAYTIPPAPIFHNGPKPATPHAATWSQAAPVPPPSTPASLAPSREAHTGMQALFHVAAHLQKQNGSTPANLQFLHNTGAPSTSFGLDTHTPGAPPQRKRQFAFTSPEEVTLDTGRAVLTASELKAFLAAHFGIPAARLRLLKVDGTRLKVLREDEPPDGNAATTDGTRAGAHLTDLPPMEPEAGVSLEAVSGRGASKPAESQPSSLAVGTGKGGHRPNNPSLASSVNIKQKILLLRDGDTLVAMDAGDDPDGEDTWCAGSLGPSLGSRVKLGPAPLNTTWDASGYLRGPSVGPTEKKHRRPEAALRIRMDEFD